MNDQDEECLIFGKIIGKKTDNQGINYFKVLWKNQPISSSTWQPQSFLINYRKQIAQYQSSINEKVKSEVIHKNPFAFMYNKIGENMDIQRQSSQINYQQKRIYQKIELNKDEEDQLILHKLSQFKNQKIQQPNIDPQNLINIQSSSQQQGNIVSNSNQCIQIKMPSILENEEKNKSIQKTENMRSYVPIQNNFLPIQKCDKKNVIQTEKQGNLLATQHLSTTNTKKQQAKPLPSLILKPLLDLQTKFDKKFESKFTKYLKRNND